jgi:iron complex outermembrane recepter protein
MRPRFLALLACSASSAFAQSPPSADSAARAPPALDEIVVSARRREENLEDTPVSVTVFGADELARRSVGELEEIAAFTPDLRASAGPQGGSAGQYFARGVGQLDFIASTDPGVGVYVDGVYLGRTTGATFDLLDVERVEVLRGPQGTLFGRNTIGGALSVVSASPPARYEGSTTIAVGARDRHEARVVLGGPLGDGGVLGSIALLAKDFDGWQQRLVDGARFGDERTYAARAALDWPVSGRFELRAALDATKSRGTADPHYLAAANPARGGRPEYVVTDPSVTWSGLAAPDDLDVRGTSVAATYSLPSVTLKSITAYRSLDSSTGADFDGSPYPDLDQLVLTDQRQTSEELQLSGATGRIGWLAGAFYFHEHVEQQIPLVLYGRDLSQNNVLDNHSTALFAHLTFALTDKATLSGGGRWTYETKRHAFDHYFVDGATTTPLFPPTTLEDHWSAFTPKIGVDVRATESLLWYVSLSQGFRSGGFNGRPVGTDEFLAYDPETLTTLEAGLKSEWLEHRIRLNAALFRSSYEDIQLTRTTIGASGAPIVVTGNAGDAEIYGVEAELMAAVTRRLTVSAGVGNLHNHYTQLEPGAAVLPEDKLPVSPHWTASASVDYTAAVGAGALRARVDWSYTSRFNYFFDNPALSWEEPHRVLNARLSYAPAGARWQVALFARNAADESYAVFREDVRQSFGTAIVWPAEPHAWGADFRLRF